MIGFSFRAPEIALHRIVVLVEPDWTSYGYIRGNITPTTRETTASVNFGTRPFSSQGEYTHICITNALGPIGDLSRWRLYERGKSYLIRRIRDWNGYYILDLDQVQGG